MLITVDMTSITVKTRPPNLGNASSISQSANQSKFAAVSECFVMIARSPDIFRPMMYLFFSEGKSPDVSFILPQQNRALWKRTEPGF